MAGPFPHAQSGQKSQQKDKRSDQSSPVQSPTTAKQATNWNQIKPYLSIWVLALQWFILLWYYYTSTRPRVSFLLPSLGTQNNITSKINLLVFYYQIARSKMTIIIVFESTQNLEYSGLARVFWWCDNNRKNMFNSKQQQHQLQMVLNLIIVHDQRYHKTINRALDHIIRSVPFHSIIPPTPANCECDCLLPACLAQYLDTCLNQCLSTVASEPATKFY